MKEKVVIAIIGAIIAGIFALIENYMKNSVKMEKPNETIFKNTGIISTGSNATNTIIKNYRSK